jgi:hypothetical protein
VNWRWQLRGFLVHPQIVFIGDAETIQFRLVATAAAQLIV